MPVVMVTMQVPQPSDRGQLLVLELEVDWRGVDFKVSNATSGPRLCYIQGDRAFSSEAVSLHSKPSSAGDKDSRSGWHLQSACSAFCTLQLAPIAEFMPGDSSLTRASVCAALLL
jgi:hypothetical protein